MDSIEDISAALQNDGIMDENGIVDTYTLLEQKLKTGNGSDNKDVYVIEDRHLYYYDKNGEKTDLGNLWDLKTADNGEDVSDLFEVDDDGNLWLKDSMEYGFYGYKVWTIENLVIPTTVDGKEVKNISIFNSPTYRWISGSSNLKTVVIPEGIESIGEKAFNDCSSLTSIIIPDSVTSIGKEAFSGCYSLIDISIPDGITDVGAYAFENTLYYTNQPDGDVYIGKHYYNYKGTMPENTSISIKDGTVSIGNNALKGYSGLIGITIPASLTQIGSYTFANCPNLQSIGVDENNSMYDSRDNCNAVIEKNTNKLIKGCENTSIPTTVTSIGENAFMGCSAMATITIPNSIIDIGTSAFSGCTGLTEITIPNSVTNIGRSAFERCSKLNSVIIPDSVTKIGYYSFRECSELPTIVIPNSVTDIGGYAFAECSNLKNIVISDNIDSINDGTFEDCESLTSITIPDSVTTIGGGAFSGCKALINIIIPNKVQSIGRGAFSSCIGLSEIVIPNNVTDIGGFAFARCSKLTNVTLSSAITCIKDSTFWGCTSLLNVTIPDGVTTIEREAFYDCSGLTSVTVPNSVTEIDVYVFKGCTNITSITIPKSVTGIGFGTFLNWVPRQTINFEVSGAQSSWANNWDYGCNATTKWNVKQ